MNTKRLFVAGLPWAIKDNDLRDLFAQFGPIVSAKVITDRETGKSKGFGFVEFSSSVDADNARKELDGSDVNGRTIVVNVARPQEGRN